jgi:N-acetylglucosamine kinase-like BadF-type ATPase
MLPNKDHYFRLDLFQNIPTDTPLVIIADSGGTKTSWAIIANNHVFEIETSSFHVNQLDNQLTSNFINLFRQLINNYPNNEFHFFGAGCLNPTNKSITESFFQSIGLKKIHVKSDLIGAGQALFNDKEGIVGILGTGSVAIHYNDQKILKLIGGLGYLIGDEGSGYYFGKKILYELLNHKLEMKLSKAFHEILGSKDEIMNEVYGKNSKSFIGSIAEKISSFSQQEIIQQIHRDNLQIYIENLYNSFDTSLPIGIIGSYGYNNQTLINELFQNKNIPKPSYICHPIKQLIEQFKKNL